MVLVRLFSVRVLLLAAIAAVLAFCGRGLGLWSSGAATTTQVAAERTESNGSDEQKPPTPEPAKPGIDEAVPLPSSPSDEARVVPSAPLAGATTEVAVLAVDPAAIDPAAVERADEPATAEATDQLGARLALANDRLEAFDFRAAEAIVEGSAFGAAAEPLRARIALQRARALDELERAVQQGRFQSAMLATWAFANGTEADRKDLQRRCEQNGWTPLLALPSARTVLPIEPPPSPDLHGRLVLSAKSESRTRVVAQRGRTATLRVVEAQGVTFPTVAVWQLEPDSVTADEAVELGLAALQDGEPLHARLWCAIATARGAASERHALLVQALR